MHRVLIWIKEWYTLHNTKTPTTTITTIMVITAKYNFTAMMGW